MQLERLAVNVKVATDAPRILFSKSVFLAVDVSFVGLIMLAAFLAQVKYNCVLIKVDWLAATALH